jgi:hypothetical protein
MTMTKQGQTRKTDPPFDFALGRLFGDDNQRCKTNGKCAVEAGKLLGGEADFSAALLTKA